MTSIEFFGNSDLSQWLSDFQNEDPNKLALKAHRFPKVPMGFLISHLNGRLKAKKKLPVWFEQDYIVYPDALAVEQASSFASAEYKSQLLVGDSLLDLTSGLGVDDSVFAKYISHLVLVEFNEHRALALRWNLKQLGLDNFEVIHSSAEAFLNSTDQSFGTIYIDPDRRPDGRTRTYSLNDNQPDVIGLFDKILNKCDRLIVKASPMVSIPQVHKESHFLKEVHVVAVKNECKEVLFVFDRNYEGKVKLFSTDLQEGFIVSRGLTDKAEIQYGESNFLYEPNVAILKAGIQDALCDQFEGLKKLAANTHIYFSIDRIPDFPGRKFEVLATPKLNKKEIKRLVGGDKLNITTRNFPASPEDLHKKLATKPGGEFYLFACKSGNGESKFFLCKRQ